MTTHNASPIPAAPRHFTADQRAMLREVVDDMLRAEQSLEAHGVTREAAYLKSARARLSNAIIEGVTLTPNGKVAR